MPHGSVTRVIPANAGRVFDIIHDYPNRLKWDTLLQAAYLESPHTSANVGVTSVCKGRALLGGIALRTQYVSFQRGVVAAVKMLNQPPFFGAWAASIRHTSIDETHSEVTYTYQFTARPAWLQWLLHPIMGAVFRWETRRRLDALARYALL